MPIIVEVKTNSPADKFGIKSGDVLISINGSAVEDILDYEYLSSDETLNIVLKDRKVAVEKEPYEPLGLGFDTFLIDKKRWCRNKCIFCFVDQLPATARKSLRYKDDDYRLSFLQGNYVTLTNLTPEDEEKIVTRRISPLNISVHASNPKLRAYMLGNPKGALIKKQLKKFKRAGITMHCQIVVCGGINDGKELSKTLRFLYSLYPAVQSVSVVPVGLTAHREGLSKLKPIDSDNAYDIISRTDKLHNKAVKRHGTGFCYCADELYIRAGVNIPDINYYDDFPQLENGVGIAALTRDNFENALKNATPSDAETKITFITGRAAYPEIAHLVSRLSVNFPNITANVIPIDNDFFGSSIDVTGLICGNDIIRQLKDRNLGDVLVLPDVLLRHDKDVFLDNSTIEDIGKNLNIEVKLIETDGAAIVRAVEEITNG